MSRGIKLGVAVCIALAVLPTLSRGDVLPKNWRRALVSIEMLASPAGRLPGSSPYQQIGTGFWVTTDTKPPFRGIMVTARHVFEEACNSSSSASVDVLLRVEEEPSIPDAQIPRTPLTICDRTGAPSNPAAGGPAAPQIITRPRWINHPRVDLAAILTSVPPGIKAPDIRPFPISLIATATDVQKWLVAEGDDVLMLSFYPNAEPDRSSSAIVRQGVIAEFGEQQDTYLISLPVFPGNSGAPVLLKPTAIHYSQDSGTQFGNVNPSFVMGVVIGYITYQELAVSPQTKRPRVAFEENSGLTFVVRPERITELILQAAAVYGMAKP